MCEKSEVEEKDERREINCLTPSYPPHDRLNTIYCGSVKAQTNMDAELFGLDQRNFAARPPPLLQDRIRG